MLAVGSASMLITFIWIGKKAYIYLQKITEASQNRRIKTVHQKLRDQFVYTTPTAIKKRLRLLLVVGITISIFLQSVLIAMLCLLLFLYLPFVWVFWIERKRKKAFEAQLLHFFPFLSSVLRAGHTLEKAIAQSCKNARPPLSQEMDLVQKEMKLGHSFETALSNLLKRMPDKNLEMAVSAISIARKMGASIAEAIDHIALTISEKEKLKQEIKALTAQGKMQAWVTGLMPVVLIGGLQIIAPGYLTPLFASNIGQLSLTYCLLSLMVAIVWIYHISNKEYL